MCGALLITQLQMVLYLALAFSRLNSIFHREFPFRLTDAT